MLHYERVWAFYEWMAGWTLLPRLTVAAGFALLAVALSAGSAGTTAWLGGAIPAGVVLRPLLFGAASN